MKWSRITIITKIHLVISIVIVVPAAVIYGFDLGEFIDLNPHSIDEYNFLKAIMGVYLGFSILWMIGIFNQKLLRPALISNVIFMCGLGAGRLLSMVTDGIPSPAYVFGTIGELVLGFYGLWIITKFKTKS